MFGGDAGLRLEKAVERADRTKAAVKRDGQDRQMVQSRVGKLPLRFFQAVDIGHLVEVPKTERARDTSGNLVFRLSKLACDVGDFQVGQSDELSELPRPLAEESRNNIDRLMCLQLDPSPRGKL